MAGWTIWSLPRRLVLTLLVVELAALAVVGLDAARSHPLPGAAQLWTIGALVAAGVVHTELALGVERVRRRVDSSPSIDLSSVWTFAAALLLPGWPAAAVVLLIYLHMFVRVWRPAGVGAYRAVFSTAAVVLAVFSAGALPRLAGTPGLFGPGPAAWATGLALVLGALVVYCAVNLVLVAVAIHQTDSTLRVRDLVGHRDELALELCTLAMGAIVAGVVDVHGPAYVVLVVPPLVILHRTVLFRQLEKEASTDSKTGLLNAAGWRLRADQRLQEAFAADGDGAVLMIDIDRFKHVNDRYGHLAGDRVLSSIAAVLTAEFRGDDLVGRFGGEEFVVLLAAPAGEDLRGGAVVAAERVRRRVADLITELGAPDTVVRIDGAPVSIGVTVSIGVAVSPTDGTDLDRLIEAADTALYAAKAAGRNAVRSTLEPDRDGRVVGPSTAPHALP